jgi:hypothetical protein
MPNPEGLTYARRKNGDVVVNHHGRIYKRGNERDAMNHPRNHR